MAVDFNFLRFRLNTPSWERIFEPIETALAMGSTTCLACRRTHPCTPCNLDRTIYKLHRANKVTRCAVFFLSPR
jgi:hypothetical protein